MTQSFAVQRHNQQYEANQKRRSIADFSPQELELLQAFARAQLAKTIKTMPLPDYRGYPVATPHGLRRLA